MQAIKIATQYGIGKEMVKEMVRYERREDGWWVDTSNVDGDGWRLYARPEAKGRDVTQLLRKEYDERY